MENFIELSAIPLQELIKGGFVGSLQTANLTIAYTRLDAGAAIPLHQHPEEAVDILLDGILEMQVGEKSGTLERGMISIVPSGIPHQAKAITDCRVVTIFYPKRVL
jgi:quercetin dioxygenase-like cupin family protein